MDVLEADRLPGEGAGEGAGEVRSSTSTSSAGVGYVSTSFMRNRSICASGRTYVPSSSMGFWVASTMKGLGSG